MPESRPQKLLTAALALLLGGAGPIVSVRGGDHDGYSRVVFVLPPGRIFTSQRLGNLLILSFPDAGQVPGLAQAPTHILSVQGGVNQAALGLPPGTQARIWRIDQRVIVDVFAPPP